MRIRNVKHKGLKRLIKDDDRSGLSEHRKIKHMVAFLQDMEVEDDLRNLSSWRAHRLGGDLEGTWSLFVTRNWRVTFRIEDGDIIDLDFVDYH